MNPMNRIFNFKHPRKLLRVFGIVLASLLIQSASGWCAELSGVITSKRGLPVSNAKVIIRDMNGKVVQTAVTDKNGMYRAQGLKPATYTYTVDGAGVGFSGGNPTVAHLPPEGLNISWTMTSNAALAQAAPGPAGFQVGADNVTNFFSGMSGPVGTTNGTGSSSSGTSSSTDPTGSASSPPTSGAGGPGVPAGPSGVVGGVPVGAVILPVANKPKPNPKPASPSQ